MACTNCSTHYESIGRQVQIDFSAFEGNWGSAPTRMWTCRATGKTAGQMVRAMETKPGARPHCGMKILTIRASRAVARTARGLQILGEVEIIQAGRARLGHERLKW